jgi:GNAT superfamily N-acetyltransferase
MCKRSQTRLEAVTNRLERPLYMWMDAHSNSPAQVPGDVVVLRDGRSVSIRPVLPSDKEALAAGFAMLSIESRHRRFLSPLPKLAPRQLAYLTEVDHRDHEALVALDDDGVVIGVARYIRLPDADSEAEAAVTVVDDWQRQGLGRELVLRLAARARGEGVRTFVGYVLADNLPALRLLRQLGFGEARSADGGLLELRARTRVR